MAGRELDWKYTEGYLPERDDIALLRQHSVELGIDPISAATGAQLAFIAAASHASSIIEIGTGIGVSALWLMSGTPEASFTSIDSESDYQQVAKAALGEAGVAAGKLRLITGDARRVLPRMNEDGYDLVFVDADVAHVEEYVEHGLRLVDSGGIVIVAHALLHGMVADPVQREEPVGYMRSMLATYTDSRLATVALNPVGDGLLQLVKR